MKLYSKIGIGILACASLAFISPALKPSKTIHVVIDAGHGGQDFGAKNNAAIEKEIVAQIASKIKAQNTNQAIVLHFTRNEDEFVELHSRAALINNIQPDLFISLHINAMPTIKNLVWNFSSTNKILPRLNNLKKLRHNLTQD